MEYVANLRHFRQERKLTQQAIADKLNIPRTQWIRYEQGQNELPIRYLIAICKEFHVSADWLLGLTEEAN